MEKDAMVQKPLITVGIPVFNGGRFIRKAIESVLKQSYSNIEIIVTNDASKDNSLEIIKSINDSRLIVVDDKINHGLPYRLNQQINLANGEYFVRMDQDDIMFPDRIKEQLEYLEKHPSIDVCGGNAVVIGDDDEIIGLREKSEIPRNIVDVFCYGRYIHPTVMGKTSWFKKWKYSEDMCECEDLDLWIRSYSDTNQGTFVKSILFYRDPIKFKIRTFIKRQIRISRCYWIRRGYLSNPLFLIKCYVKVLVTIIASVTMWIIGCDKFWIKRRNKVILSTEKNKYKEILIKIQS